MPSKNKSSNNNNNNINNNNSNNNNNNNNNNNIIDSLKKQMDELLQRNKSLEARVSELEEKQVVSSHVNSLLSKEVDRLNQYTRRSNLVLRNVFAPENESVEQVEEKV